jgi:hypothetical protein
MFKLTDVSEVRTASIIRAMWLPNPNEVWWRKSAHHEAVFSLIEQLSSAPCSQTPAVCFSVAARNQKEVKRAAVRSGTVPASSFVLKHVGVGFAYEREERTVCNLRLDRGTFLRIELREIRSVGSSCQLFTSHFTSHLIITKCCRPH